MRKYFSNIWEAVRSCSIGLGVTFKHLFHPAVTVQYPDERMELSSTWKGRHRLYIDTCIGCMACSRACPAGCIKIELERLKGQKKKIRLTRFTVNLNSCLFCGFCQDACPTDALELQPEYETLTFTDKKQLVLNLLSEGKYSPDYVPEDDEPVDEGSEKPGIDSEKNRTGSEGEE